MNAIFIRHGVAESNQNILDRTVGAYAELTAEGVAQIRQLAPLLGKLAASKTLYASPYPRTMQSAQILADELGMEVVLEEKLEEIYKGDWQGRTVREVIDLEAAVDIDDRPTYRPPGDGENWQDVGDRVAAFVEELRRAGQLEVIMVSHDHPIRMGIGKLLDKPLASWEDMPLDHGSLTVLRHKAGHWQLEEELVNIRH